MRAQLIQAINVGGIIPTRLSDITRVKWGILDDNTRITNAPDSRSSSDYRIIHRAGHSNQVLM
jgi:hypothetical protein